MSLYQGGGGGGGSICPSYAEGDTLLDEKHTIVKGDQLEGENNESEKV